MSRIMLMGAPGVGKSTQARMVSGALGVPHITAGSLFREQIAHETVLGVTIATTLASGRCISDEVTTDLLRVRLAESDAADGFVLDGFPRTATQVAALDDLLLLRDVELDGVLLLRADIGILLGRLADRRRDGRVDDMNRVPGLRLANYFDQTEPLARVYDDRGLLRRVDGAPSVEDVAQAVTDALRSGGVGCQEALAGATTSSS